MGFLTKNSSEKSNAPHMPGVPSLGLNIDRCIIHGCTSTCTLHPMILILHCRIFFHPKKVKHVPQTVMKTMQGLKTRKSSMPRQENLLGLDDAE